MINLIKNKYRLDQNYFINRLKPVIQKLDIKGDISIKLGSEDESRDLNQKYLQKDYPTDVLSFPIQQQLPEGYYLGDIFICMPIAREQAKKEKISLKNELLILMIHGILHLAGYDHEGDNGEMFSLQDQIIDEIK
ncbi:MAG: rRNA maturation RNase YbeY [Candidatus Aminicenantes bacterium]|nr:rRNA maturation RNase YbeY [Candidatus Aminicenantes bacterium]